MSRHALVVGINHYQSERLGNLKLPAQDAEQIGKLLETYGEFKITYLPERIKDDDSLGINPQAEVRVASLKKAIAQLFTPKGQDAPTTALLFFAGHGVRDEIGKPEGFLASSDADLDSVYGVSLRWLRDQLRESSVPEQIVWLDCCHAGELLNFNEADPGENIRRCFIAASRSFEAAYEDIAGEHGVLSKALLRALDPHQQADGRVSNHSLAKDVSQQLRKETQEPVLSNSGSEIILTRCTMPSETDPNINPDRPPYKGLEFFRHDNDDPEYFFGREATTDALLEKLRSGQVVTLLGVSGSGKSSVARAGLLHQLQQGQRIAGSEQWTQVIMQPGLQPLDTLVAALIQAKFDNSAVLKFNRSENPQDLVEALQQHSAPGLLLF